MFALLQGQTHLFTWHHDAKRFSTPVHLLLWCRHVCFVAGADTPVYLVSWCRLDTPVQLLCLCRHVCFVSRADTPVSQVLWCRLDTPVQLLLLCRGILLCLRGRHTCAFVIIMQRYVCFVAGADTPVYQMSWCRQKDITHLCKCYYHADMSALLQEQTHLCTWHCFHPTPSPPEGSSCPTALCRSGADAPRFPLVSSISKRSQRHIPTPSTGLWDPSSSHCLCWLCHVS